MAKATRSFVKILLVFLNVVATILTLLTGLWYTPVVTSVTGRYDAIRQRLLSGSINRAIAEPVHYRLDELATPIQLADFEMGSAPRRDPKIFGEYHSVCTNLNTMAAPVLLSNFDDYWGKGARRVQTNMYSISAPHCDVVTVRQSWRDQCVADHYGDPAKCYAFVLDNFDAIRQNKSARAYAVHEFGTIGVPFLRCLSRPLEAFPFLADLLSYESMWAGSDHHVVIQTSVCRAEPLVQSHDQWVTLFQSVNVDEAADVVVLFPPDGWVSSFILWLHSIATVVVVTHGMVLALLHSKTAQYLPEGVRFGNGRRWLRFALPFTPVLSRLSENERAVISFKGSLMIASDVWKTHWMYMWVSIFDGLSHVRRMYVTFQLACTLRFTPMTFIFLCGAITKITWVMCFVQTMLRIIVKLLARSLRSLRIIRPVTRARIEWDIDGISMFLSWRIFNLLLSIIVFLIFQLRDKPTFMMPATPALVGVYGGPVQIAGFSGSELACDLVTLLCLLTVSSQLLGLILIKCTKYRYVADNSVMRMLGDRYWISGWDGLMAADMLGLDPTDPDFLIDGYAYTKLSIGSLLQLLYQSGPSGLVHLAGDYIFHDGGFSKEPIKFRYTIQKALSMGLIGTSYGPQRGGMSPVSPERGVAKIGKGAVYTMSDPGADFDTLGKMDSSAKGEPSRAKQTEAVGGPSEATAMALQVAKSSIFDRQLRIVSEGYAGKLLLLDVALDGTATTNKDTGRREFVVVDALTLITIMDIKWILGRDKRIRVR